MCLIYAVKRNTGTCASQHGYSEGIICKYDLAYHCGNEVANTTLCGMQHMHNIVYIILIIFSIAPHPRILIIHTDAVWRFFTVVNSSQVNDIDRRRLYLSLYVRIVLKTLVLFFII